MDDEENATMGAGVPEGFGFDPEDPLYKDLFDDGDKEILDEQAPFLNGILPSEFTPALWAQIAKATAYNHTTHTPRRSEIPSEQVAMGKDFFKKMCDRVSILSRAYHREQSEEGKRRID